eukprot:TRINITY_DN5514_c0_g2_i2.p1 TRINITY_DN5514_c0_g2~~TRINITY_DN5514_c0_g2_i2.p1  ORF type:complete len:412 (+),score=129.34 TRINITY_DN5514_c0_g2_i2:103-1236(+)
MKALILVGGYGTRLRPFTLSRPKPTVELCNKGVAVHQMEALAAVGVRRVVLAMNYRPDDLRAHLAQHAERLGIELVFSLETEPLGTAGPIALARKHLEGDEPFFVLNSDVTCTFPLAEMLAFHRKHGGEATILNTRVADPSKYGVIVHDERSGLVERFAEKPKTFVGDKINAGVYVLSPEVLRARIPEARRMSIEREVFPAIAADHKLYTFALDGFWMDVGQPADYITGTQLLLGHLCAVHGSKAGADGVVDLGDSLLYTKATPGVVAPVLVDKTARLGAGHMLGPNAVIGRDCVLGEGVRLDNSTVLAGARVGAHTLISGGCIVGWRCAVGRWVRMEHGCLLGEDVHVADELLLNGAKVLPNKDINASVPTPEVIM